MDRNMSYITQEDISEYIKDNSRLINELVRIYTSKFNVSVEDLYEDIMCYITSIVYFYKKYRRFSLDKLIKRRALNLVKKMNKERLLVDEYRNNII